MVSLFITHIRRILDYCSYVWNVGGWGDLIHQRPWTREIDRLGGVDYGKLLRALQLFSIKGICVTFMFGEMLEDFSLC